MLQYAHPVLYVQGSRKVIPLAERLYTEIYLRDSAVCFESVRLKVPDSYLRVTDAYSLTVL